ncbi:hypothetical protein BJY00DRAFT_294633 [Aspergillus carlsbadensis]|nr:hypothetical protein BJY00DRAFT_294633 [Aspergillus carlsbadensis]
MPAPLQAEIIDGIKTFIPLENNPEVLKLLCENLQISPDLDFHDIVSAAPEVLHACPQFRPCHALIVLADHPIYKVARPAAVESTIPVYKGSGPDEPVLWMKQTIGHACGLMALLHVVFNLEGGRYVQAQFAPGTVTNTGTSTRTAIAALRQQAIPLAPTDRAQLLYDSRLLEEAHMDAASRGSSTAPSPREYVHHHFLAFVKKDDGEVWELNGDINGPVLRGVLGDGEDLLSERGLELTVNGFLGAAGETGCYEMSIVAVTGGDVVARG